jgi:hypothetical protein
MDMQVYSLHVIPVTIIFYGVFILFMRPPLKVAAATLIGGLVMALLNLLGDVIAIHASLWYYSASGLVAQLPLPFYTTPLFITGGLAYFLIWRFWHSSNHWFAWLLLIGVPIFGFLSDLYQGVLSTQNSFLLWKSPLAWLANLVLWGVMFFAGYFVFQRIAPARQQATQQVSAQADASAVVDNQK